MIMVNNAGIETRTSVLDTTEAQYEKVLAINLKSAFFGTQLAAQQMIKQDGGGRIINITSVHEDWPMPGNIPYCLSKGGMRMLTRTAGVELAPHDLHRRRHHAGQPGAVTHARPDRALGSSPLLSASSRCHFARSSSATICLSRGSFGKPRPAYWCQEPFPFPNAPLPPQAEVDLGQLVR